MKPDDFKAYQRIAERVRCIRNYLYVLEGLQVTLNLQDGGILRYKYCHKDTLKNLDEIISFCDRMGEEENEPKHP